MKLVTKSLFAAVLATATLILTAQDAGQPPAPEGGHRRPAPPVVAALDANQDGVIDAAEIANASNALLTLDKNGDGQLTADELRPTPPEGGPKGKGPRGDRKPQ